MLGGALELRVWRESEAARDGEEGPHKLQQQPPWELLEMLTLRPHLRIGFCR